MYNTFYKRCTVLYVNHPIMNYIVVLLQKTSVQSHARARDNDKTTPVRRGPHLSLLSR